MSADINSLKSFLIKIYKRKGMPDRETYQNKVLKVTEILNHESAEYRPHTCAGLPGGIIYLKPDIPTIIIPDLHARMDFMLNVLLHPVEEDSTVLDKLGQGKLQIVCVGDAFHAESRAIKRWLAAYQEFIESFRHHKYMDEEMRENLGLMEMIIELKSLFPAFFHFLKGNHENVMNERGEGNYPFYKFCDEGLMVSYYLKHFYGEDFLQAYYLYEKTFPVLAVGRNFLISHAEPVEFFEKKRVIEYRTDPEVIYGLTWTDNDTAEQGSVEQMINHYLPPAVHASAYYFGGHRVIDEKFSLRAENRFVQIHHPFRFNIAYLRGEGDIELERDILQLDNNLDKIVKIAND
jgi:hypothetical protein